MSAPARPSLLPPWVSIIMLVIGIGIGYLARPQDRWHYDHLGADNGVNLPIRVDRKTGKTEVFCVTSTVGSATGWRPASDSDLRQIRAPR